MTVKGHRVCAFGSGTRTTGVAGRCLMRRAGIDGGDRACRECGDQAGPVGPALGAGRALDALQRHAHRLQARDVPRGGGDGGERDPRRPRSHRGVPGAGGGARLLHCRSVHDTRGPVPPSRPGRCDGDALLAGAVSLARRRGRVLGVRHRPAADVRGPGGGGGAPRPGRDRRLRAHQRARRAFHLVWDARRVRVDAGRHRPGGARRGPVGARRDRRGHRGAVGAGVAGAGVRDAGRQRRSQLRHRQRPPARPGQRVSSPTCGPGWRSMPGAASRGRCG